MVKPDERLFPVNYNLGVLGFILNNKILDDGCVSQFRMVFRVRNRQKNRLIAHGCQLKLAMNFTGYRMVAVCISHGIPNPEKRNGAPDAIRTRDFTLRSGALY